MVSYTVVSVRKAEIVTQFLFLINWHAGAGKDIGIEVSVLPVFLLYYSLCLA